VRLIRAELLKLRRPLVLWTFVAVTVVVVFYAWSTVSSADDTYASVRRGDQQTFATPTRCDEIGMPEGDPCQEELRRLVVQANVKGEADLERSLATARALQHPLQVGGFVAGLLAALPGAVALSLLAAGHIGHEWSSRTIKEVLVHEGRRSRILWAKLCSLWLAGIGLMAVQIAVLAALAPAFRSSDLWRDSGVPLVRTVLVLAAFASVGVACAVLARSPLGSFALACGLLFVSLVAGGLSGTARGTLTYWVSGWMGPTPLTLWARLPDDVPFPSHQVGLAGLLGCILVAVGVSGFRLVRTDVEV
jgi:ABC-2 family transporter protein